MMKTQSKTIQRYLDHLSDTLRPLTDRQLIDHFALHKDEESFGLILERFGPLVMGVCRRILGNRPEAEDAFQTTFLIFTQQIQSLRNRDSLAGWLYRVAYHAALKARPQNRRLESFEEEVRIETDTFENATWNEIRGILDEELNRLPERLRVPLVLCYFDGATCDEAAKQLHWSLRTFKRRLEEGRKRLHVALTRRGLSGLVLGIATLLPEGLKAEVSPSLLKSTRELLSAPNVPSQSIELGSLASSTIGSQWNWTIKSLIFLCISAGIVLSSFWFSDGGAQGEKSEPTKSKIVEKAKTPPQKEPFVFGSKAFRHPESSILDLVLSPDGKLLATCSWNKFIVWDLETGKAKQQLDDPKLCRAVGNSLVDTVMLLSFSPNGQLLAQVSRESTRVRLWDMKTGKEVQFIHYDSNPPQGRLGHEYIANVTFLDEDRLLIWGDKKALVWSIRKKKELAFFTLSGPIVAISPDRKEMLHLKPEPDGLSVTLLISDPLTGKEIARLSHPGSAIGFHASYSSNGKQIVTTSGQTNGYLWDRKSLDLIDSFELPKEENQKQPPTICSNICFSHDQKRLFLATTPKSINSYDLKTKKWDSLPIGHFQAVWKLNPTPDGKMLISISWDRTIRRWDLEKNKEIPFPEGYIGRIHSRSSPESKLVCIGDDNGRIDLWNHSGSRIVRTLQTQGNACRELAFSTDGKLLASLDDSQEVRIWELSTGKELKKWKIPGYHEQSMLAFLPDSSQLLIPASSDQSQLAHLQLWDWKKGKALWDKPIPCSSAGVLSPDGQRLLTSIDNTHCSIISTQTGKEIRKIQVLDRVSARFPGAYIFAAFSPNHQIVAIGLWEGEIQLWDTTTGQLLTKWQQSGGAVGGLLFSLDGDWLFGFDVEKRGYLLDARSGIEVARTKTAAKLPLPGDWNRLEYEVGLHQLFSGEPLPKMDLETAWEQLRSDDPAKGFQAIRVFAEYSEGATFLRKKILPAKSEDHELIKKWIADLDSDRFAVRESALKKLSEKGKSALGVFEEVLKGKLSPGTQEQLTKLLETARGKRSPEETRLRRAVESMSWSATPEAIQTLEGWAKGSAGELLTQDALQALKPARLRLSVEK